MSGEYVLLKLAGGKSVWAHPSGEILAEFDGSGNLNEGCISNQEKQEARQLFAETLERMAHETAASRQSDPRFQDIRSEIFRRGTPEEIQRINLNPNDFNFAFEKLHGEVGPSLAELDADVARADETSAILGRLTEQAADPLAGSQDPADIVRLLALRGGK